ncbi:putative late blight resistance protein homolog R1A-3 [Henckelia pumila]|uniref:putative late blight resistance protein homolog R1A-3 n=1 Tax=Henckelia pumila TaxID=405737 RepID=UPI003C6DD5FD
MTDRSNLPLPKFGEWNLKNGGAGQYSMIFEKARNTKRAGGDEQDLRNSPRSRETVPLTKQETRSPKTSAHKSFLGPKKKKLFHGIGNTFMLYYAVYASNPITVILSSIHDPRERSEKMASFIEYLRELFKVPGRCNPGTNEILSGFIYFLLDVIQDIRDHSADMMVPVEDQIGVLCKELKFLITILWDKPMHCAGAKNQLIEIKEVANQSGSFLFLFFFTVDRFGETRIDLSLAALFRKIELLKSKIIDHCVTVSTQLSSMTAASYVVSPYVLHFLLEDLEELKDRDDDVINEMRTLYEELLSMQVLFSGMEAEQKGVIQELERVVITIRDIAYEARYIIELFTVEDVPLWYFTVRVSHVRDRIQNVKADLAEMRKGYNTRVRKVATAVPLEAKTLPLGDDHVVGFEDEANKTIEQLVGGSDKLQVISICGMPGLGKTTSAKKLYKNPCVIYRFYIRVWAVVSQTYRRRNLLAKILIDLTRELEKDSMDEEAISKMDDERVAERIYKSLIGRRYLLVMDDVWNSNVWNDLRRYLPDESNGSRVLFTSRSKDVVPCESIIQALPFLSHDQCWALLQKKVFQNEACPPELLDTGMQIAEYCQGLPLSVVVIASVLANLDKKETLWQEVAKSIKSHVSENLNQCLNILDLSYKHLPEQLKVCFLYFGVFPEDEEISVKKLISMWIAEGFVHKKDQKSLEDAGKDYLMDLIGRSLVLVSRRTSTGGVKACRVHDLLRDLCLRIVREEGFLNSIEMPFGLHVRSLLGFSLSSNNHMFQSFKLLRVLEVPLYSGLESVESFVSLRYLATEHLGPSLGHLVNLEILIVHFASKVSDVFLKLLMKLFKLKCLHFKSRVQFGVSRHLLDNLQAKSFQMKNLQAISFFRLYHGRDEEILRFFPCLIRLKSAFVVDQHSSPMYPVIDFLTQLESLTLYLEGKLDWFQDMLTFPLALRKLALHKFKLSWKEVSMIGRLSHLEVLKLVVVSLQGRIWDTSDNEFQELKFLKLDRLGIVQWNISNHHFPKLVRLVLRKCSNLEEIPASLGDIPTLQMIEVEKCGELVAESAMRILEEQQDMGNEELKVIVSN